MVFYHRLFFAVSLIAGASCLVPLNLLEVKPFLLPDDHPALLLLLSDRALLAPGVLKLQCELVQGARNNLSGKVLYSEPGPLTFSFRALKLQHRPINQGLLFGVKAFYL